MWNLIGLGGAEHFGGLGLDTLYSSFPPKSKYQCKMLKRKVIYFRDICTYLL